MSALSNWIKTRLDAIFTVVLKIITVLALTIGATSDINKAEWFAFAAVMAAAANWS